MLNPFTLDPFILRAIAAGIGVALVAGPLGCFVVWRRMAYFGDSLAHSALLGVALGLIGGIGAAVGTVIVCSLFAIALVWLQHKRVLATDTLLGILAHAALSIGLVAISFLDTPPLNLHSYLFGDILTVQAEELFWIYGGSLAVAALLLACWPAHVLMTINEDMARAEGIRTFAMHLLFMFLMTVVVAGSIRIVGILLITSMLIIPAATARQIARSPEGMALAATFLGIASVCMGMAGSLAFDTPSGPSIVTAAVALFALLLPIMVWRRKY